ncbi:MAG: RIP metalloprotease RseP [Bacteroidaceae bacterium]|nr:RIP metalloprotease RseP [Bacteroidaceae bacterium]
MAIFLIKALQLILSISLLVILHEGGHFAFARLFGIRVEKFYLFFDWKFSLFKFKPKNSDTEFGIGWIPLGGYCKIAGMVDESFDTQQLQQPMQDWEFRAKPAWQRLFVMIGGVLMNFITALFIYSMIMYTWGDSYIAPQSMTNGMQFNDEAKKHGFKDGDIIIGTDEEEFERFDVDVYRAVAKAENVIVIRDGKQVTVHKPETSLLTMLKETPRYMDPVTPNVVDSVFADGPAAKAGMLAGDKIVAVDSTATKTFNDVNFALAVRSDILETAKSSKDSLTARNIALVVQHANAKDSAVLDTLHLTLTEDLKMGVAYKPYQALYEPTNVEYSFLESFPAGIKYGLNILGGYVSDMQYLASADGAKSVGGFGTLGGLFPETWNWYKFWLMTAFLSIVLAFMNILPIPALDGGHVLFLIYEMITGKEPSEKFLVIAEYLGFGFIFALMIWANFADILRALGIM